MGEQSDGGTGPGHPQPLEDEDLQQHAQVSPRYWDLVAYIFIQSSILLSRVSVFAQIGTIVDSAIVEY